MRRHQLPERLDGFGAIATLHQREPQAVERVGDRWIERHRPPQARDSALEITETLQRNSQLQMRLRERR